MCGRFAATAEMEDLIREFDVSVDHTREPTRSLLKKPQDPPPATPDTNMAPTKQAPVVLTRAPRGSDAGAGPRADDPIRQLRLLTWGLVPSWAKDAGVGIRMINARAETLLEKPAFAKAAASRRCLIPAAGWYEWQRSPVATDAKGAPRKQPFFIHRGDGAPIAFAGLYEFWRDPSVEDGADPMAWLSTFTIITTAADPGMDRIHDRQPLVLERDDRERWLDPQLRDLDEVAEVLAFAEPGRFTAYPVSTAVNGSAQHGPHLLDPLPAGELVGVVDPETGEVIGG